MFLGVVKTLNLNSKKELQAIWQRGFGRGSFITLSFCFHSDENIKIPQKKKKIGELKSKMESTRRGQASRAGGGLIIVGVFIIAGGGSLEGIPFEDHVARICLIGLE